MRASTSAWASGDSFGAFEGCCAGSGAATDSGLKRFDRTSEAAADAKAARRANSRREIAESLLLPIASSPCLEEEVQKYEWTAKNEATESAFERQLSPQCGRQLGEKSRQFFAKLAHFCECANLRFKGLIVLP